MGVETLNENGSPQDYLFQPNSEYHNDYPSSQTLGNKLLGREGNSPDCQLRSLIRAKWIRKFECRDSQDVGLEAATI